MKSKRNPFSRLTSPTAPLLSSLILICASLGSVQAASTWSGLGPNTNWTTGSNWIPVSPPLPGITSDLIFAGTVGLDSTFDYSDQDDFRDLTFNASAGAFTIAPDTIDTGIDLYGNVTNNSVNLQTLGINLYLQDDTRSLNATAGSLKIDGAIYTNSNTLRITGTASTNVELNYGTLLEGDGEVAIDSGTLKLGGTTFAATPRAYTIASAGTLNIAGNTGVALGTTTIAGGGTLLVTDGTFGNEGPNEPKGDGRNIFMNLDESGLIDIQPGATLINGGWGSFDWAGNFADLNVGGTFDVWDGKTTTVDGLNGSGLITKQQGGDNRDLQVGINNGDGDFTGTFYAGTNGGWTLVKLGTGTQKLSGIVDYNTARARVEDGVLLLNMASSPSVHATGEGLTVNGGTAQLGGTGGDQIFDGSGVTVNGGTWDMNGLSETINFINGSGGTVSNSGAAQSILTINTGTRGETNYGGSINGDIRVVVTNAVNKNQNVAVFSGTNGYTGRTLVDNGQLRATVDAALGAVPASFDAANITLQNGGILQNSNSDLVVDANRGIYLGDGGGVIYAGWLGEGRSIIINGVISGPGSFTKTDGAPLTVNGTNTYTGNTTVNEGILTVTSPNFADASTLTIGSSDGSNAVLDLPNEGTDVVGSLVIDGVAQAAGFTYDSGNSNGAISGLGKIQVVAPAGGYSNWAIANGIPGEPATGDFDNDGLANVVEYALGLDPKVSSVPAGTFDGTTLSFTKGEDAIAGKDVNYIIETSIDLGVLDPWAAAVTQNAPDLTTTISYDLPQTGPRFFARLKIVQIP